jgi:hypothetical protein
VGAGAEPVVALLLGEPQMLVQRLMPLLNGLGQLKINALQITGKMLSE